MEFSLNEIVYGVVFEALEYTPEAKAMIIFDEDCGLTTMLTEAYKAAMPAAILVDFNKTTPDEIKAAVDLLSPKDLVVMVQSTSFRLNEFRFRLELFNRSLKVIEHPHLGRIPEVEWPTYIKSLIYDKEYYRTVGPALKAKIDKAQRIVVSCDGAELVYDTLMEDAKLNIGDYTGMKNTGGQFPIGEVFTEPTNMSGVNGTVKLFAFGDNKFRVIAPEKPVLVVIKEGIIVDAPDAPPEFVDILDQIRMDEQLWVRELGFGMNRAMTRDIRLTDIGSYERMCGIHLSLGQKHTIYAKPGFPKRSSRYHVDVFVDVTAVTIDGEVVFKDGRYLV
ncbi:TPA: hypothetical protein DEP96_00135 [Candidatus Uhrbacteria bacterium]|nr:hypothetical protein [Candidatus Uhrbacteria bacterium]